MERMEPDEISRQMVEGLSTVLFGNLDTQALHLLDEPGSDAFTASIAAVPTDALMMFVESGGGDASPGDPNAEVGGSDDPSTSVTAVTAVTGVAGTAEGVFAGTEGVAPCAPDQLIDGLDAAEPETVAWADIQEIDGSIPSGITRISNRSVSVSAAHRCGKAEDRVQFPDGPLENYGTLV